MDDGQWTNFKLTRLLGVLTGLFLLVAPAIGAPSKAGETPSAEKLDGEKEPIVFAESAAVIDSYTGEFLFLKNENAIPVGRRGILFEHMDARRIQLEKRFKTKAIIDFAASGN